MCIWRLKMLLTDLYTVKVPSTYLGAYSSKLSNIGSAIVICDLITNSLSTKNSINKRLGAECSIPDVTMSMPAKEYFVIGDFYRNKQHSIAVLIMAIENLTKAVELYVSEDYQRYYEIRLVPLCTELENIVSQL